MKWSETESVVSCRPKTQTALKWQISTLNSEMCSRTALSRPRPRPQVFEAKAKAKARSLKVKVKASELWAQRYPTCRSDVTRRNKAVNGTNNRGHFNANVRIKIETVCGYFRPVSVSCKSLDICSFAHTKVLIQTNSKTPETVVEVDRTSTISSFTSFNKNWIRNFGANSTINWLHWEKFQQFPPIASYKAEHNAILRRKYCDIQLQSKNGALKERPRPRPPNFVLEVSSRTRTVLEDPSLVELRK